MTTELLARNFTRAHRESGCWRAACPVHQAGSRYGRSLAIYPKGDRSILVCYSGCASDDILAAVNLTWKDALYEDKTLSPAEKKEWAKQKAKQEQAGRQQRADELWMFVRAIYRTTRPVSLSDLRYATMEHRMESYFKTLGAA